MFQFAFVVFAGEEQFLFRIDSLTYDKVLKLDDEPKENLVIPILFGISTSDLNDSWGDSRSGGRIHTAIDIKAPLGEIIVTPTESVVTKIGYDDLGGNFVITANPGVEQFYYAHMDKVAAELYEGAYLEKGDVIGYVGGTGNAYGNNHLHFEIYSDGQSVNPFSRLSHEFSTEERVDVLEKILASHRIVLGAENSGVRFLQQFLIKENVGPHATALSEEGATGYFGEMTEDAVREFQESRDIDPAVGFFGEITREKIIASINPNTSISGQIAGAQTVKMTAETSSVATNSGTDLELGDSGEDVKMLQEFLIRENVGSYAVALATEGATGYFGKMTKDALIEFQDHEGINPAEGYFGTITRVAIGDHLVSSSVLVAGIKNDLELGDSGEEVEVLQQFLIEENVGPHATALSEEGATGYFGEITHNSLVEYQKYAGIFPAEGYFGSITRAAIQ